MNLEDLTKHQILLLTLLVSFVTSIATGIVTVSLMDQAPPGVTKTVNRIVQHTVERVVPPDLEELEKLQQQAAVVESVVEKIAFTDGSESLADAVATVSDGIVRVYSTDGSFVGYGSIVSADGRVIVPMTVDTRTASAVSLDGENYTFVRRDDDVLLKPTVTGNSISPLRMADISSLEVGVTLYSLSRGSSLSLRKGNYLGMEQLETGETRIATDIIPSVQGTPLFATDGSVIGISRKTGESYSFLPISAYVEAGETETDVQG